MSLFAFGLALYTVLSNFIFQGLGSEAEIQKLLYKCLTQKLTSNQGSGAP